MNNDIIFLVGYPRSGTTFLERKMHQFMDCSMSNEVDFLLKKKKLFLNPPALSGRNKLNGFIDNILRQRFFNWYKHIYSKKLGYPVSITKQEVLNRLNGYDVSSILYAIFSIIRDNAKRSLILCKDPNLTSHIDYIDKIFPESKIIHIVRDGRDCHLSMRNVKWGDGNVYATAKNWKNTILAASRQGRNLKARYLEIKYEDLLSEPGDTIEKIQLFIWGNIKSETTTSFVKERKTDPLTNNTNKWKKALSIKEIQTFDYIALDGLIEYEYERCFPVMEVTLAEKIYYEMQNRKICFYKKYFTNLPF